MTKVGLVPMAAKPYHVGHDMLVRLASRKNDEVHLYVSTGDRDNVSGAAMTRVWKELIEPTLPSNVTVTYGGSPVGNVFKELGEADKAGSQDTFTVYSDPDDLKKNYGSLAKYAGNLLAAGQIILRAVSRSSTVNVSGTQMRRWLATGDRASFVKHLPKGINRDRVWDTLRASQTKRVGEGLLRSYIHEVVSASSHVRLVVR
jgi:hypothetical protein